MHRCHHPAAMACARAIRPRAARDRHSTVLSQQQTEEQTGSAVDVCSPGVVLSEDGIRIKLAGCSGALAWPQRSVVGSALKGWHAQIPTWNDFCSVLRVQSACPPPIRRPITRSPPPSPQPFCGPFRDRCAPPEQHPPAVARPPASTCSLLALTGRLCIARASLYLAVAIRAAVYCLVTAGRTAC
jgi:hypothetical protein